MPCRLRRLTAGGLIRDVLCVRKAVKTPANSRCLGPDVSQGRVRCFIKLIAVSRVSQGLLYSPDPDAPAKAGTIYAVSC